MKHLKKYISFVLVILCLTIQVFAAVDNGVFYDESTALSYTPSSATIRLTSDSVRFTNLEWIGNTFVEDHYWEGEIRARSGYTVEDAYTGVTAVVSDLPGAYKEYDTDDVSIGCSSAYWIVPGNSYYGTLTTDTGNLYNSGVDLYFESEMGVYLVVDGFPIAYQYYDETLNTRSNTSISWNFQEVIKCVDIITKK